MSQEYACVLDNALLTAFVAFQRQGRYDTVLVEKLLRLYHPPYLTCQRQLAECEFDEDLQQQAAASGFTNQSLEDLAQQTRYRIILTDQSSDISKGCFNIADSSTNKLGKHYSLTAKQGEIRKHLIDYLVILLNDANDVIVCDEYFEKWFRNTQELFTLMSGRGTNVYFVYPLGSSVQKSIEQHHASINYQHFGGRAYANLHDRYLVIDR